MKKRITRKKVVFKQLILTLSSFLLILAIYCLLTPSAENVLMVGVRKVLANMGIYTEEIKKIDINSVNYDSQDGGEWHIEKEVDWIGPDTAQITFNVNTIIKTNDNYKDVILVLDTSASMYGDRIDKVKEDTKELINYLLLNDENRVALITFDSTSKILSEFTKDKDAIIEQIDLIKTDGTTNYSAGLLNVDKVLEGYVKESNRDLITFFLTDGYPNIDTPNQIGIYKMLKEKYPYNIVNGVQYEMGSTLIQEIVDISDRQYSSSLKNLNNVLFETILSPDYYNTFELSDYINNDIWYVEKEEDIKAEYGDIKLLEENQSQKILWNFNNKSLRSGSIVKMTINLKLKDEYVNKTGYYATNNKVSITYNINDIDKTIVSNDTPVIKAGYKVIYDNNLPSTCKIAETKPEVHYAFETISINNTKLTCDGYIFKGWEFVENDIEKINTESFLMPSKDVVLKAIWSKPLISKSMYGNVYKKDTLYKKIVNEYENKNNVEVYSSDPIGLKKDVYYYTNDSNNNVLFGGYCWKIVRTTETDGIKLLYNGLPSSDNKCMGDSPQLTPAQMGIEGLSSRFNETQNSLGDVGYMYNKRYTWITKDMTYKTNVLTKKEMSLEEFDFYYADDYTLQYNNRFYLTDAQQFNWKNNYENLIGKYTCRKSEDGACISLFYIIDATETTMYYLDVPRNSALETTITLSKTITDNKNGTYTLDEPIVLQKKDWHKDYENYRNYYTCGNNELTCETFSYITENTTDTSYNFLHSDFEFKYGNSFTYDETTGIYTLIDTELSKIQTVWNVIDDITLLSNAHYTCFSNDIRCEQMYYIYYGGARMSYIALEDGKDIRTAMTEMLFSDDVNTYDSSMKKVLEYWYKNDLLKYNDYIEDTIWCNDRYFSNYPKSGWNPDGGSLNVYLNFGSYKGYTSIQCPMPNDRFTVSSENGNGKLAYPIGLLTRSEVRLFNQKSSTLAWTMSPRYYGTNYAYGFAYDSELKNTGITEINAVRPSISLKNETSYLYGDGTADSPYVITK